MNMKIYFDNNATTKCDENVVNAMLPYFTEEYGNPSSTYSFGKEIKDEITKARRNIAKLLNADENEIIFTSCASESNVTAIMNAVNNNPNKKGNIRDYASINELICISNMENINAVLIEDGLSQQERLIKLNKIAIHQMSILEEQALKILQ